MVNINPDGKFIIESGQGLTQGIQKELGLTDEQCKQLGSIWTQIINEFDNPENMKVTNNGSTAPNKSNNYLVCANAVVEFSANCWNKIVVWINNALKTNISTLEDAEDIPDEQQTAEEKEQICKQAYEKIRANINKLNLPQGVDKSNIEQKLLNIYQSHLKNLPETTQNADMANSMLYELVKDSPLSENEKFKFSIKTAAALFPDGVIGGIKCSEISADEAQLDKAVELYVSSVEMEKSPEQSQLIRECANELISEIKENKIKLPENVDKNKVIEFLQSEKALNPPDGVEVPSDRAQLKLVLINIAMRSCITQIRYSENELEVKINNVKNRLNEVLKGKIFKGPNNTTISGEQLLEIINKKDGISVSNDNYGAARADIETGQIIINTNAQYNTNSDAELMKIIIHEALHCAYKTSTGNTWDEERCCESQAIAITAEIVNSEKNRPDTTFTSFPIYNRNIEDFTNRELLDSAIELWLETGYSNRPKNSNGDITIIKDSSLTGSRNLAAGDKSFMSAENRIEIKSGDEVFINGHKVTNIGSATLESIKLSENGNSNICRLRTSEVDFGCIIFDGTVDKTGATAEIPETEPKTVEIRRNGVVICTGKIYRNE